MGRLILQDNGKCVQYIFTVFELNLIDFHQISDVAPDCDRHQCSISSQDGAALQESPENASSRKPQEDNSE